MALTNSDLDQIQTMIKTLIANPAIDVLLTNATGATLTSATSLLQNAITAKGAIDFSALGSLLSTNHMRIVPSMFTTTQASYFRAELAKGYGGYTVYWNAGDWERTGPGGNS